MRRLGEAADKRDVSRARIWLRGTAFLLASVAFLSFAGLWAFFFLFDGCLEEGTCSRTVTEHLVAGEQLVAAVGAVAASSAALVLEARDGPAAARGLNQVARVLLGLWIATFVIAAATGLDR